MASLDWRRLKQGGHFEVNGRRQWFIRGSEILLTARTEPEEPPRDAAGWHILTPAAIKRMNREAKVYLRRKGILT
jgi:hypothetical protein